MPGLDQVHLRLWLRDCYRTLALASSKADQAGTSALRLLWRRVLIPEPHQISKDMVAPVWLTGN
jgi:hypothetical protein